MDRGQEIRFSWLASLAVLVPLTILVAMIVVPKPAEAASYPDAVLLVSGFQTETPFTTPSPSCAGKEGDTWGLQGGPAQALRAAGKLVFTAPETKTGDPVPTPCAGVGEPLPGANTVIATNGDTNSNGAALARLIAFIRDNYGVTGLHIVGHSDGGLWSRAAITQDAAYTGVNIRSLTTLGTPHTGSYLADLAMELNGGKCDFSNEVEQDICDVVLPLTHLIVDELGPKATAQLSNDFLTTWNAQQAIGDCPVSAIAGDHISFGIPFIGYYTPSDGLVGLDSAQAREALDLNGTLIPAPDLPGLKEAGVYDVVHGASLSFLYKKTLLNQTEISNEVVDNTLLTGSQPCNGTFDETPPAGEAQSLRAPLYRMIAAGPGGKLPKAGREDFVVGVKGVTVRCGKKKLPGVPLLGDPRVRTFAAGKCGRNLRATSPGRRVARALMLRSNPHRHVAVRVRGDRATFRVAGSKAAGRVEYLTGGKWRKVKLDGKGRATLPETPGKSLKLRVRVGHGNVPDTANLTIQH